MTQIWERLFLGSLQDAERLARGNPHNIDKVISFCEQCVEHQAANIRYIHLPVEDAEPVPVQQFEAVMKAISASVRNGNVLLHCAVG